MKGKETIVTLRSRLPGGRALVLQYIAAPWKPAVIMWPSWISRLVFTFGSPNAACALDTAGHDGLNEGPDVFVLHGPLPLCESAPVATKHHGLILNPAKGAYSSKSHCPLGHTNPLRPNTRAQKTQFC